MRSESDQLHIFLFPLMAPGHMLPMLDIAKLFASRGVKSTIITTPQNASRFTKSTHDLINLKLIKFPSEKAGLPLGLENLDLISNQELNCKFFEALALLQQPLDEAIQELQPHAIVSDFFFPWTTDLASKNAIPRLIFHGTSFISMCCLASLAINAPHKNLSLSSDAEEFVLPGLPVPLKFTKSHVPDSFSTEQSNYIISRILRDAREVEKRSFGILVNSFYELEPAYVDNYRSNLGKKAWHIGPVSLSNKNLEEKAQRGDGSSITQLEHIKWLDSKKPNSVIYVCFGTNTKFEESQLQEIAIGLEKTGENFIWVVRDEKNEQKWLPEGYKKRNEGKGLIIRGFAPQVLILDHKAIGGFVTHCGWNSALEGISAGLPMVTWPIFADQFFNEKLITEILKIGVGVGVGAQKWVRFVGDFIKSEKIEKAIKEIMEGEKAEEIKNRAKKIGEMARKAIEDGGSSYNDLTSLIQELKSFHP